MQKYYRIKKNLFFSTLLLFMFYSGFSQERTVTGKVTDENNAPLPGVNILIKGTSTGSVSDAQGNFTIASPGGSVLVFSFVGYTTQEVEIGSQSNVTVSLQPDVISLSEIVVTGYGSQSKRDITGAVATVNTEQLLAVPSTNVAQAMQGRVAGVNISNENAPGGGVMVRIRGYGTINDNSPLFVVDGMPTKGNLNTLNFNDVESVQVLKDASAASIPLEKR